jgi:hypothetical protein
MLFGLSALLARLSLFLTRRWIVKTLAMLNDPGRLFETGLNRLFLAKRVHLYETAC